MSTHGKIVQAVAETKLHRYQHSTGGATLGERQIWLVATAMKWVFGQHPEAGCDPAKARAALDDLLSSPEVRKCQGQSGREASCPLKRMNISAYPAALDVWEVRIEPPDAFRLIGFFIDPDILVLTHGFPKKAVSGANSATTYRSYFTQVMRCHQYLGLDPTHIFVDVDINAYFPRAP